MVRIPGSHPGGPGSIPGNGNFFFSLVANVEKDFYKGEISNSTKVTRVAQIGILPLLWQKIPTRMGFEPTRAEPIGLAVQRRNHSATSSLQVNTEKKEMDFPRRELNPGLLGESQIS